MPTTLAARSKLPTYCAFTLKRSFKIIEKFNRKFGICKAFSKTHLNFPPLHRTYQPGRSSVRIRHLVDEVFCDFFDLIKAKMTKFQSPQFNVCAFDNSRKKSLGWMAESTMLQPLSLFITIELKINSDEFFKRCF